MNNSSTIFLSVASLCYIIMIIIIFFSKKPINTSENKVFARLLVISFLSLLSEIYITLMPIDMNYKPFVMSLKAYLLLCLIWLSHFMEYVFIITRNNEKKSIINYKKLYKKVYIIFWVIVSLIGIAIILAPINFFNENGMKYSYGLSVNIVFGVFGLYTIIMLFYIIKNIKNLKNNGYTTIIVLVILLVVTAVIQEINPSLLLANTCFALVTSLMYHTLENPDLKMAKELFYSKSVAEDSKSRTIETLNDISDKLNDSLVEIVSFAYKKIDKNNNEELNKEIKYIQNYSIKFADEITGLIEMAKINSGELKILENGYDVQEMIDSLNELFNYENQNNNIDFSMKIEDKFNNVLYGDPDKVKQINLNLFTILSKIIKTGKIKIIISNMKVGRFCRIRFHYFIEDETIKNYLVKDDKKLILSDVNNEIAYITLNKLLDIVNGKLEIREKKLNQYEFVISIDQRIISSYKLLEQEERNKNINVKYFDASDKRVLIVDDNKTKIKELVLLLQPYKIQFDIVSSFSHAQDYLMSNKTYDLVLLDDLLPDFNIQKINDEINEWKSAFGRIKRLNYFANYDFNIVLMSLDDNSNKVKKLGFNDYILKPINKQSINEVLKKYVK